MPLPEIEQHRAHKLLTAFCDKRVPLPDRDQVKMIYKVTGSKVILAESRPDFQNPSFWINIPIAQFEYSSPASTWTLYAYDRNDKRKLYSKGPLEHLIQEVDKDPTGIFWG